MRDKYNKILNSFWPLQIGGWLIYLVMIYITFLTIAAPGNFFRLFEIKGFRTIVGFFITLILWRIYRRLTRQGLSYQIVIALATAVLFGIIWAVFEIYFFSIRDAAYDINIGFTKLPRTSLDYAMTLTAWSALYFGIKNWQKWQAEKENALEAKALANRAQLEVLRFQLNPHFLFNALNSIRASVDEDKDRAKQMITQFSEFLRYSLLHGNDKLIPFREELEAIESYLAIEKIRFEEKLQVEIAADEKALDYEIPPFIVHPLIENAIKHGGMSNEKPLDISLKAKAGPSGMVIEVANNGRLSFHDEKNGTGIGLKNISERLQRIYGERAAFTLSESDNKVVARIEIGK